MDFVLKCLICWIAICSPCAGSPCGRENAGIDLFVDFDDRTHEGFVIGGRQRGVDVVEFVEHDGGPAARAVRSLWSAVADPMRDA